MACVHVLFHGDVEIALVRVFLICTTQRESAEFDFSFMSKVSGQKPAFGEVLAYQRVDTVDVP